MIAGSGHAHALRFRIGCAGRLSTYVHPISEHVAAARAAGWRLVEMHERLIDDRWIALKPKWARLRHHPISLAFIWSAERR